MTDLSEAIWTVLDASQSQLQASELPAVARTFDSVSSLLRAGEPVVGFEILCDNLYEDDILVEQNLVLSLLEAARRTGADTRRIEMLLR